MEYKFDKINKSNRDFVNKFLIKQWHSTDIVIRGKVFDLTKADGFVMFKNTELVALVTYVIDYSICEITSLDSLIENQGIGSKLINKVVEEAKSNGCKKIKLITTNDNLRAFGFYQKRGFNISNIFLNAIENSRKIKPEIPLIGENNIPIRD